MAPHLYDSVFRSGRELMRVRARGLDVLGAPRINRGVAFTHEQREALGLTGLLPEQVQPLETQARRAYEQVCAQSSDVAKHTFLTNMRDRNEVLFYRLLAEHLEEFLPIVYTPTIGTVIERFSSLYNRPRGVFLSIGDAEVPGSMERSLLAYGVEPDHVDLVVVTDSEGILGIGDQGVGGIQIALGKLSVYTAAAGINPGRAIPVVLDAGTDNLRLLNDSFYLGRHHSRVRGEAYDEFVDAFVDNVSRLFPNAMIHWEDFGANNAHRILEKYRSLRRSFNDDIQGTAAVVAASVLAAVEGRGESLADQRIVVHGAGTAGIGVADLLVDLMTAEGLDPDGARRRFWCLGSRGLITTDDDRARPFQRPYGRGDAADWTRTDLTEVVRRVRPTVLIGTSAQPGAFTEPIVREMADHCERPVILPLSNPTTLAEAQPADLLEWTDGAALIATGSPFAPVVRSGDADTTYEIAQANNALVFPGIGLGVVVSRARLVSDGMIAAAARAVGRLVRTDRPGTPLLPSIRDIRTVSATVAVAVVRQAIAEGLAEHEPQDVIQAVTETMWQPVYPDIEVV